MVIDIPLTPILPAVGYVGNPPIAIPIAIPFAITNTKPR